MKTIDNTIKYYELIMKYDDTSKYIEYKLPTGYHFEFYKPEYKNDWINIHISSEEFTSKKQAKEIFYQFYSSFIDQLDKRCFFIIEDKTNTKVATATISLLQEKEYGYDATIDWLAIRKDYQGRKLSKALISKCIELANTLGHPKLLLHTQTTTWLAAKLYLDYGFEILHTEETEGWEILKAITHHSKLQNYKDINTEQIFDKRNQLIQEKLNNIYGKDNFHYSVWYKNGLHNVYVFSNGTSDEYEYFEEESGIKLVKIENKFPKEINFYTKDLTFKLDQVGRSEDQVYIFENKYILKISKDKQRLKREMERVDFLSQNNIPGSKSICLIEENDTYYYLRTYIEGVSLIDKKYIKNPELLINTLVKVINTLRTLDNSNCPYKSNDNIGQDFVHGDLCLPNILVNENNELAGFIDLENSGKGDRWYDYSWLLWSLKHNLKTDKYNEQLLNKLSLKPNKEKYNLYIPKEYREEN